jgi:hypothetical protein
MHDSPQNVKLRLRSSENGEANHAHAGTREKHTATIFQVEYTPLSFDGGYICHHVR